MTLFTLKQNVNWVAIGFMFLACLVMNFVIRHGLNVDTTVDQQMRFVGNNENIWHISWFFWHLAAISLFVFSVSLYGASKKTGYAKISIAFVFFGLIVDLVAQYILSFKLSEFASMHSVNDFVAAGEFAIKLTGVYANGLCNLGGLTLTLILLKEKTLSKPLAFFGLLGWCLGLAVSLFMLSNDMASSEWITAIAMSLSLVFMGLVNAFCFSGKGIHTV